jgi:hypothetical protein
MDVGFVIALEFKEDIGLAICVAGKSGAWFQDLSLAHQVRTIISQSLQPAQILLKRNLNHRCLGSCN